MTLMNATSLNDQVDYSGTNGHSFAEQTLNAIFNVSPRNAVIDDDDDDDLDQTLPDPDEDDLIDDDDDDAFPDDLDTLDDDVADDDDLDEDDDTGSTTSGLNNPSSFADRPQGRTTGRMTDHEPGSPNNL
ncbi:hypothetical protein [Mucilaginibacter arboris]|uniref:Uncharacterized protein n=1 Tax=Mucilaginibacter arboris TaxID=2682090 RepID=A0A7K1T0A7_9SPHI|nr:hypothetical protein [Mucilaginibacter arboris]MVN22720.1 hypothetical protein [Mucilaginibacter arboris]